MNVSAGEVGGIFAGVTTLLAAIGAGIAWLLGWKERREDSRAAKLQKWHDELVAREKRLDEEQAAHFARLETRLTRELGWLSARCERTERQVEALLSGYQLVSGELRALDPTNPKLGLADEFLKAAFRLDPVVPPDMSALADKVSGGSAE